MTAYDSIFEYVNTLTIIDSHEHLPSWEHRRETETDILREYLAHYFSNDLMAAGMTFQQVEAIRDPGKPLMERWKAVEPYWKLARNTAYGRALDLTVRSLYGADRIDGSTVEGLNEAFVKTLVPGHSQYRKLLKEMSRIEYSVLDNDLDYDPTYFRTSFSIDNLIFFKNWKCLDDMECDTGICLTSFDDWLEACTLELDHACEQGTVALKLHAAYRRSLYFANTPYHEAEACFRNVLEQRKGPTWNPVLPQSTQAFQDYMLHYIMRYANQRGLTCQIHTGLQESGRNLIANSDPSLLSNLFIQYPNVKFDLFHIGYPYQHVMSALGKMFANVYLDMCWAHIISPAACINALDDWLDSVPVSKIIAFGGDYIIPDAVYAHQLMARRNISKVLAQKVEDGIFDLDDAKWMAKRMFYDNPKSIFETGK